MIEFNEIIEMFSLRTDTQSLQNLKVILDSHETLKFEKCSTPTYISNQNQLRIYILYSIIRKKFELNEQEDIRRNFNQRYNGFKPFQQLERLLNIAHGNHIYYLTQFMKQEQQKFKQAYFAILQAECEYIKNYGYNFQQNPDKFDEKNLQKMIQISIQQADNQGQEIGKHELFCLSSAFSINIKQLIFHQTSQGCQLDEINIIKPNHNFQHTWCVFYPTSLFQLEKPLFILLSEGDEKKKIQAFSPSKKKIKRNISLVVDNENKKKIQEENQCQPIMQQQNVSDILISSIYGDFFQEDLSKNKKKEKVQTRLEEEENFQEKLKLEISQRKKIRDETIINQQMQVQKFRVSFPKSQNYECPVCGDDFTQDEGLLLQCNHTVHRSCLQQQINVAFNDGKRNFSDYICPIEGCKSLIENSKIQFLLTAKQCEEITRCTFESSYQKIILYCPNAACGILLLYDQDKMSNKQIELKCHGCNNGICSLCKNKYHGVNAEGEQCPQIIEEIRKALGNEKQSVCPNCKTLCLKDDGCNHVSCMKCKKDFCFVCCADRVPILAHGNHYHRLGCTDYKAWIDNKTNKEVLTGEFNERTCTICRQTKQPCPRPENLDTFKSKNKWFQTSNK